LPEVKRLKLFAGIELDDACRAACVSVAQRLERAGLRARFESPEKLHITLAFLGCAEPEAVEAIREVLRSAASGCRAFVLTLDKVSAFPSERRARVVWIGSREQGAAFRKMAQRLRERYEALGFSFDKPAVAHITVARSKGGTAHLPLLDVHPIRARVRALTLFESIPAGSTTRYEVRARFSLGGVRSS